MIEGVFPYSSMKLKIVKEEIPRCACAGVIKPDIVFFGENVKDYDKAIKLAQASDLFFVIGTSCVVFPAAQIPQYAPDKVVIVNLSKVIIPLNNIVLSVQENLDSFFLKVSSYEIF